MKIQDLFSASLNENAVKKAVAYVGRKTHTKVTRITGKPDMTHAPKWAKAVGKTPEGAWHWLEKEGPVEDDAHDFYFPLSGKTEFSGFVES